MTIDIVFHITYDRDKDGSLAEFKKTKYDPFQRHVEWLQTKGHLPRGNIRWSIKSNWQRPAGPPLPSGPAMVARIVDATECDVVARAARPVLVDTDDGPIVIHAARTRLDPERIAV